MQRVHAGCREAKQGAGGGLVGVRGCRGMVQGAGWGAAESRSPTVRARGRFDLATLPVDFVECLMRFLPTEAEVKALRQYERERKPLEELADEDRFMLQFSKVERLPQRMAIMAFLGNFTENLQMLTPVQSRGDRGDYTHWGCLDPAPQLSPCPVLSPCSSSMPSSRPRPPSSPRRS